MRPILTFQTGRDLAVKPRDAVTDRTYTFRRSSPTRRIPTPAAEFDDSITCNESGYDALIKSKGITSSSPVVLGIVPLRDLDEEQEIINIQRNLNIHTILPVSKLIDSTTGSFTQGELAVTSNVPTQELKTAFNDLFAVYKPKVNYLRFIDDFLALQTAEGSKVKIEINRIDTSRSVIFQSPDVYGISSYATTKEWATNRAKMQISNVFPRLNVTNMMQMLKNTLSMLKYTTITILPASNKTFSVDGISPDQTFLDAGTTLLNLYNNSQIILEGDFDNIADQMLLLIAKENLFNASFASTSSPDTIKNAIKTLTGDLVEDLRTQDFQTKPNLGLLEPLVYKDNAGKTVLSFDNMLTSQALLSTFETADQFYLTYPIANDKQLLVSRTNGLVSTLNSISSQISTLQTKLESNKTEIVIKSFLKTLRNFVKSSMLVETSGTSTEQDQQIKTIAVLLKAREDKQLLDYIIKILMYRDRIRNPSSYVTDDQKADFITLSTQKLLEYVRKLSWTYFGFRFSTEGALEVQDDFIERIIDLLNGASIGNLPDNRQYAVGAYGNTSARDPYGGSSALQGFGYLYFDLIDTSKDMMWDVFFSGAASAAYPFASTRVSTFTDNPLTARANQTTQFYQIARDHRALAFLMSTLRFLNSSVDGSRFYVSAYRELIDSETWFKYRFGHADWYFNDLVEAIDRITASSFKVAYGTESLNIIREVVPSPASMALTATSGYLTPILRNLLQSFQDGIDGLDYVNTYINAAIPLLKDASNAAYNYNSKYGESLVSLYTANTLTNLAKMKERSFSPLPNFKKYNAYYFRKSGYLPGMVQYAQKILPKNEDSFVVICGLPYGMLERLGAYDLSRVRDITITLTFREINNNSTTLATVTNTYPAVSFIDPGVQNYDIESYASEEQFLESTRLYYMNQSGALAVDTFTQDVLKKKELESTATLEYFRALYGLDLDIESLTQQDQVNASALFPQLESAINKVNTSIEKLRYDDLLTSRYYRAAANTIMLGQQDIFQKSLSGFSFDKIIAIPIDGALLRGSKDFYLCDILMTATLIAQEEIPTIEAEELLRNMESRSSRVTSTVLSITRNRFNRS